MRIGAGEGDRTLLDDLVAAIVGRLELSGVVAIVTSRGVVANGTARSE